MRSTSMTLQTGVKEWLDGGKKRHAQALVWCTSVTQIRYGWVGSQLSSQMLILVATLLHIQDQCFRNVVVVYYIIIILRSITQMLCIHFLINIKIVRA